MSCSYKLVELMLDAKYHSGKIG
ncbi:protein of unknown function [Xenorhabdus doucetiae]|uniref:Uncharacterized protein n=1 Tax=Xenorhabdus doucetiae TaxID=351671 RepID=A0A068QNW3_9GAMM|nr:protein of unknown function [Xenorhabdus doucetiae]